MERAVLSRQQALLGAPLGGLCSLSICCVRKGGQCSGFRPSGVLPQQQGQLAAGRGDCRALRQQVFQDGAGGQFVDAEACRTHHSSAACHGQHRAESGAVSTVGHRFVRVRGGARLRALTDPLPVGIEGDVVGDWLQMLRLHIIGLFFHRLTADSCSVPANELIAFPLRAHALHQRDGQPFAGAFSLCGKAHPIVAFIPPVIADPAPVCAAVEIEGDSVMCGSGVAGGDPQIHNRFVICRFFRECSRRQHGQGHGCCQKGAEQPQLWGVPEFIFHKSILLPPFRCPVRCFFSLHPGAEKPACYSSNKRVQRAGEKCY